MLNDIIIMSGFIALLVILCKLEKRPKYKLGRSVIYFRK